MERVWFWLALARGGGSSGGGDDEASQSELASACADERNEDAEPDAAPHPTDTAPQTPTAPTPPSPPPVTAASPPAGVESVPTHATTSSTSPRNRAVEGMTRLLAEHGTCATVLDRMHNVERVMEYLLSDEGRTLVLVSARFARAVRAKIADLMTQQPSPQLAFLLGRVAERYDLL